MQCCPEYRATTTSIRGRHVFQSSRCKTRHYRSKPTTMGNVSYDRNEVKGLEASQNKGNRSFWVFVLIVGITFLCTIVLVKLASLHLTATYYKLKNRHWGRRAADVDLAGCHAVHQGQIHADFCTISTRRARAERRTVRSQGDDASASRILAAENPYR